MALFDCPKCNNRVSDKATACPHCGYAIAAKIEEKVYRDRALSSGLGFIILTLALVYFLMTALGEEGQTKNVKPIKVKQESTKLTEEQILYNKVKKIPAKQIEANRDGYEKLVKMNPSKKFYKKKYNYYNDLVLKKEKEQNASRENIATDRGTAIVNEENQNAEGVNDKPLILDKSFMDRNIGVYQTPIITNKDRPNISYLRVWSSYHAWAQGETYEFNFDEKWEMTSKDRTNIDNIPDKLDVYFYQNKVMALAIKRYFTYDPRTRANIANQGYKIIQIISRDELISLPR